VLAALSAAVRGGATEYGVAELGIPGVRHFVYKSRAHVQVTAPEYEEPYDDVNERRRLVTLYQILHDNVHARSGQDQPLKLQYIRTERESVMGWVSEFFLMWCFFFAVIVTGSRSRSRSSCTCVCRTGCRKARR